MGFYVVIANKEKAGEMSKEFIKISLPKYYTFINNTSVRCIFTCPL
jgi:hypothetical protein